jgi:hypothetical protein
MGMPFGQSAALLRAERMAKASMDASVRRKKESSADPLSRIGGASVMRSDDASGSSGEPRCHQA